ncbi:Bacteriophage Mu transposase [Vibrio quintilis]|uniref:Bacteriophage Mu transposase n=1 Tax=Vibrio quintilis TaxID=1117707 RepID=A0A1M7Z1U6_9VIBR|nr:transposase domain-containing protein [Vibrio quintilis]SHO58765.1 Bacteriophage Mu transposase [Vibrio quintilis]
MKEWFSAKELCSIGGLPDSVQGIHYKAKTDCWQYRPKAGKGGGKEYHISILPSEVQAALYKRAGKIQVGDKTFAIPKKSNTSSYCADALWQCWNNANDKSKEKAKNALVAVQSAHELINNGIPKMDAYDSVCTECCVTRSSLYRHMARVKGIEPCDWLAALLPGHMDGAKKRRSGQFAELTPDAWALFKADYLRPEKPSIAKCYERLLRIAPENGWTIPSIKSIERRIQNIPIQQRILLREGEHALMQMFPSQERSVAELHALEWINGDGYQHNVFVKWFNGEILRPKTWFWQDVYSRRIIGWRCDVSENTDSIRLSLMDVCQRYGIPKDVTIDNTRAAANKWLTGGVPNRYRFKVKPDDPLGLITMLVGPAHMHWTSVNFGKGHGQAKPVERAFGVGGLDEYIDKHPALAGAYTGPNPMNKPDNYGSAAVDADIFLQAIAEGVEMYNSRPNRQTEICRGFMSFEEAFNASYQNAPVRKATPAQLQMFMLQAEAVRVSRHGTVSLDAGGSLHGRKNRYFNEIMMDYIGKKLIVRFDPQALHQSVEVYTLNGVHLCTAECTEKVAFGDTQAAREHKRARTQFVKHHKAAAKAQKTQTAIEVAAAMPGSSEAVIPETKIVEPFRPVTIGNTAAVAHEQTEQGPEEDYEANYQANLASIVAQRKRNRL